MIMISGKLMKFSRFAVSYNDYLRENNHKKVILFDSRLWNGYSSYMIEMERYERFSMLK